MSPVTILGIETSCDETAAAVVLDGSRELSSAVASSESLHARFGGVVPEIACRAHLESLIPVLSAALSDANTSLDHIDAVAVTNRPGLVGALLIGVSAAKALAWVLRKPLLAVDHVQAHIYAAHLAEDSLSADLSAVASAEEEAPVGQERRRISYPHVSLVVSGGHTNLYLVSSPLDFQLLGATIDDAAGEAFDKVAGLLGLLTPASYHGGPVIDRLASSGDPRALDFPRSLMDRDSLDFSFSGLKTAVLYHVCGQDASPPSGAARMKPVAMTPRQLADVAASFQEAVVDVLVEKTLRAARRFHCPTITVGGGVAANSRLRTRLTEAAAREDRTVHFPPLRLCLDNAVIVAALGFHLLKAGRIAPLDLDVHAQLVRSSWSAP